ncbi:hypothetical protein [Bradyrhizobium liaoningense]|uniref:hypothetical protein n=1 Tax=Bradyrhizobium liaoningense TaxID=43992 RepID=UPI001BAC3EB2|nr:hypothetical protein [Bradyrhizobium liaoningense]MBR0855471.1 hypothetical protein [Bradyrhizobium liaoningense]
MTWVIGAASLLGYGVMLSDVRVTFPDGSTADLLRKAFPVGPYLSAGFAGSVQIGYRLLNALGEHLYVPPSYPDADQVAWQPEWVAEQFAPIAKRIFATSSPVEQRLGSRLLMVGVSPNESMGLPEIPRVYLIRFASPDFTPRYMRRGLNIAHIGSGANDRRYIQAFKSHFRLSASSLRAENSRGDGWAQMLGGTVDLIAGEHPRASVSPHVHVIICRLGSFSEGNNNHRTYSLDGSPPIAFEMPQIASTYDEFLRMCRDREIGAEGALG